MKKSRAKSCTACRQVKLRCNLRETFPGPCARCVGRKQECKIDPHFKRVTTLSPFGSASEGQHRATFTDTPNDLRTETRLDSPGPSVEPYSRPERWLDIETSSFNDTTHGSWTLGLVQVERAVILDLFTHQVRRTLLCALSNNGTSQLA
ncbi:hypothetical protein K491DRAFT_6097 [Lophiostoma macrostomum CBS 122681]|uniref:Zn(2)-C6 fungal-type domain-containing protein n=1 Tax=Lophiostoma macrostomum CBS 122681 TaxID=1314788 RepID=A0A6A6TST5_9PLEO|nr:hypothetical protein K491DRAFT_6097 [Lophiostoma macrostomum CBS 122681]